jgi:hypothetical protein
MRRYRTPSVVSRRADVRCAGMDPQTEPRAQSQVRVFPVWVRTVVWLSVAFLTMSVISGMFLY